jgi:hypothetical protein
MADESMIMDRVRATRLSLNMLFDKRAAVIGIESGGASRRLAVSSTEPGTR